MAESYIKKITLPSGSEYLIKDEKAWADIAKNRTDIDWAMSQIEAITGGSALVFKGVSSTALTDGGTENPTVDGSVITSKSIGDIYFHGTGEYIWNGTAWNELGNLESLGALAYKDTASVTASASYQPKGTIGALTFTGNNLTMSTDYQPAGSISVSASGSSTAAYAVSAAASGTKTYTPAGSVSAPTFTGTTAIISMSSTYQPQGTLNITTGDESIDLQLEDSDGSPVMEDVVRYQPKGTISTPTISINSAGTTTTINNPTAKSVTSGLATAAPGATAPANAITQYSVTSENLYLYQVGYTMTDSITTNSVNVKTGDASYKSNTPTFIGTTMQLTGTVNIPKSITFEGTTSTISMSTDYQPGGTNSTPTFTGTSVRLVTSSISIPNAFTGSFTGTTATISVSGTPTGSVTTPTFTGTTSTITVNGTAS